MDFKVDKCYKHKKGLYVKVSKIDAMGYVVIQYSDGRTGKLIAKAPGWEEITQKEWEKVQEVKEVEEVEEVK